MPTGYTSAIKDGISFEAFVLRCARAMGALVMMRDEPMDAPIPDEFPPSDYHVKAMAEANNRLDFLASLTDDQIHQYSQQAYSEEYSRWQKYEEEKLQLASHYNEMLAKVDQWEPPTPDHQEFKQFMANQINDSLQWDCSPYEAPEKRSPQQWLIDEVARAQRSVEYHTIENQKEINRSKARTEWVQALKQSLTKQPVQP